MNNLFSEVSIDSLVMNPFTTAGKQWMLITSGDIVNWNTMTAFWGGINPEDFIDPSINDNYETKDYHKMYLAGIEKVLSKTNEAG